MTFHDPLNQLQGLRTALEANGFKVSDVSAEAGTGGANTVWLSSSLDDATSARLSQGGAVLLAGREPGGSSVRETH